MEKLKRIKKHVKFVPLRDGRLLAVPWRLFSRGDEAYFAHRRMLTAGIKFSIHKSGIWRLSEGQMTWRLAPGLRFPDTKCIHVAEIDFYSNESALPPEIAPDRHTIGMLVPKVHKLVVNLWLNPHGSTVRPVLPKQFDGTVIWKTQLRNSGTAGAVARVLPLTQKDAEHVAFFERERPPKITFTGPKTPVGDFEMFLLHFHPTDGNVIQVYPLPQSTFVRNDN